MLGQSMQFHRSGCKAGNSQPSALPMTQKMLASEAQAVGV
jgi:hypothetical protein